MISCLFTSDLWRALFWCCHMSQAVIITWVINAIVHLLLDFLDLNAFQSISCSSHHHWTRHPSSATHHPIYLEECLQGDPSEICGWAVLLSCHHCRPAKISCNSCGWVLVATIQLSILWVPYSTEPMLTQPGNVKCGPCLPLGRSSEGILPEFAISIWSYLFHLGGNWKPA